MAGVNKAIVIGYLGRDPELSETSGGNKVCRLNVATTRVWNNKQTNEKVEETEWHRISVWGKQAESCNKYLSKGRMVYVEGRLRTSSYDKDGVKHYSTEIVGEVVQFLGGKGGEDDGGSDNGDGGDNNKGGNQSSKGSGSTRAAHDDDDDIPF